MHPEMVMAVLWAGSLLIMGGVLLAGYIARRRLMSENGWPGPWPRVALLVPVKGASPTLADELADLIDQNYPDYELIVAVENADDPAWPLLKELAARQPKVKLTQAGQATQCGQKNHNLLAALAMIDDSTEILVFSDAGHRATTDWLCKLVGPIAAGHEEVTSGFHHAIPQGKGLVGQSWAVTLLWMFWGRHISFMAHPWGGSTAITREAFDQMDVAELWSHSVVDDVTLAKRLRQSGRRMRPTPQATLSTPLRQPSVKAYSDWLHRQLIYIKYIAPLSWLGLGLVLGGLLALVLVSASMAVGWLMGMVGTGPGLGAMAYLVLLSTGPLVLRFVHPAPGPLISWITASLLTLGMVLWAYIRNVFTRRIEWGGISYRVGLGGRVKSIQRPNH